VVHRGGGRRSFFGGGGRRWCRPFGGGRADASSAPAGPLLSHSHSVLRRHFHVSFFLCLHLK